jgi:hypothetical protein
MLLASLAGLLLSASTPRVDDPSPLPIPKLERAITRAELEAHVRWLASDELAGRVTGTPECDRAARYLAEVLRVQGARPAGDAGTFLQSVELARTRLASAPVLAFLDGDARTELNYGLDFDVPWVAIPARELRVVRVTSADELPRAADEGVALFLDGSTVERKRWLEEAELGDGEGFGAVLVPGSKRPGRARDAAQQAGQLRRASPDAERSPRAIRVNAEPLERLRSGSVKRIAVAVDAQVEHVASSNVVARIPGSAPRDGRERAVVISAHYDHIAHGHGAPAARGADTIYNGADDDASGVAAVLEIAGALHSGGELALDVIVLLATGEEIGLLGTDAYLDHPVVPLDRTVANLNFEMLGRPDAKVGGLGNLWLTGDELTNLGALLRARGLHVRPDPRPDQHFFQRSDNFAFVVRGVIGQTLSSYDLHTDYHKPSDEADRIDFEHLTAGALTGERAVRLLASGEFALAWTDGKSPVPARGSDK